MQGLSLCWRGKAAARTREGLLGVLVVAVLLQLHLRGGADEGLTANLALRGAELQVSDGGTPARGGAQQPRTFSVSAASFCFSWLPFPALAAAAWLRARDIAVFCSPRAPVSAHATQAWHAADAPEHFRRPSLRAGG